MRWAVLASGPSLTAEDALKLRHLPTIVANATCFLAPWADAMYAHDTRFWEVYDTRGFAGRKYTHSVAVVRKKLAEMSPGRNYANSGINAVTTAMELGATHITLLGFDCQFSGGLKHHHPDHPGMSNCVSIAKWPGKFEALAVHAAKSGVEIVNATRETSLRCFARVTL